MSLCASSKLLLPGLIPYSFFFHHFKGEAAGEFLPWVERAVEPPRVVDLSHSGASGVESTHSPPRALRFGEDLNPLPPGGCLGGQRHQEG